MSTCLPEPDAIDYDVDDDDMGGGEGEGCDEGGGMGGESIDDDPSEECYDNVTLTGSRLRAF